MSTVDACRIIIIIAIFALSDSNAQHPLDVPSVSVSLSSISVNGSFHLFGVPALFSVNVMVPNNIANITWTACDGNLQVDQCDGNCTLEFVNTFVNGSCSIYGVRLTVIYRDETLNSNTTVNIGALAVVLVPVNDEHLISCDMNDTLANVTLDSDIYDVGEIISLESGPCAGFSFKIKYDGGDGTYTGVVPSITDVYDSIYVYDMDLPVSDDSMRGRDDDGHTISIYTPEVTIGSTGDGVTASFQITGALTKKISLSLEQEWFRIKHLSVKSDSRSITSAIFKLGVGASISWAKTLKIYESALTSKWIMIGPVPVVVKPSIEIVVDVSVKATGGLTVSVPLSYSSQSISELGWHDGSYYSTYDSSCSHDYDIVVSLACGLEASITVDVEFGLSFYGVADVKLHIGPKVVGALQTPPPDDAQAQCQCRNGQSSSVNTHLSLAPYFVASAELTVDIPLFSDSPMLTVEFVNTRFDSLTVERCWAMPWYTGTCLTVEPCDARVSLVGTWSGVENHIESSTTRDDMGCWHNACLEPRSVPYEIILQVDNNVPYTWSYTYDPATSTLVLYATPVNAMYIHASTDDTGTEHMLLIGDLDGLSPDGDCSEFFGEKSLTNDSPGCYFSPSVVCPPSGYMTAACIRAVCKFVKTK